ncbi:MAG: DUF4347 domain-containing protein [Desulfomonile tiedjei]|nr:DUF4347 domain-containing protein [Desulfomonile tiedjei]
MSRSRFWSRNRNYRPLTLLQQLEERIVLDAAVNPAPQDNPNGNPSGQPDQGPGPEQAPAGAEAAGGSADGNAGLVGQVPDSYQQVFNQDLNVVLVANNLADVHAVTQAAAENAQVITYDAAQDNLATITAKLQDLVSVAGHTIDNLAIVGHGTEGNLVIGTDQIQFFSLAQYSATFEALGQTLSQDAQIQFYGCSIAGDAPGQAMVDSIAVYTAADTFASTNTTGGTAHDWTLEYSSNSSVAMNVVLNAGALASDITPLADAVLVTETDTSSPTLYNNLSNYAVMGQKIYFSTNDGIYSTNEYGEPWVYDMQTGTATLLKDIAAQGPAYGSVAKFFTVSGGKVYFQAQDYVNGTELWVSDGIAGGDTHMVGGAAGLNPTGSSTPTSLIDVNNTLYFLANDGSGQTLWKTDGTNTVEYATGTAYNPYNVSGIGSLTNVNGTLYFVGTSATYGGAEVYMVDGTGNIALAANINTAAGAGSNPASLTAVGSMLYLVANDGGGLAVHQINGTTDTEIPNNLSITAFANLTNVNGTLFFAGTTAASGQELYQVSGGAELLVQNINANGTSGSSPASLTAVGSTLYFTANDGTGVTLWQSDGTTTGKVQNLTGNDAVTSFTNLTNISGKLYFTGSSVSTGSELYKVEAGNIALAQDLNLGENPTTHAALGSNPKTMTDIGGGKMIFTANDGYTGIEPWIYDGTNPATSLDINHLGGGPQWLTNVNGTLYFAASDGAHGLELWKSDPVTGVTSMVADLSPGTGNGVVPYGTGNPMVNVNGTLFFLGNSSTGMAGALFKIDNATGQPVQVKDVATGGSGVEWLVNLTAFNDTLYFQNYDAGMYYLWRSDGTATGTVAVTDPSGATIRNTSTPYFTNVNGTLYFQGGTTGFTPNGAELYKIDANGHQVMVQDLNGLPGSYVGSSPSYLTEVNGTLYFAATVNNVISLYEYTPTDPTPTISLVDNPGGVTNVQNLTNVNGSLFFTSTATGNTGKLFYVDGAGTIQGVTITCVDPNDGSTITGTSPLSLYNSNGTLFFSADSTKGASSIGKEVWTYDTATDTISLLKDINPTSSSVFTTNTFMHLDGLTYFKATDGTTGDELWQTDGTTAGTVRIGSAGQTEIYPGATGSNPANLTPVNTTLFFTAQGLGIGTELWKVQGAATNAIPTVNAAMNQSHTINEDSGALNLQDIFITDGDIGDTITATLTLNNLTAGALSSTGGTYNPATGIWSMSGAVGDVNLALQNLAFTPNADWNGTVNVSTHVHDAHGTGPANGLITINVSAVNDGPVTSDLALTIAEDNSLVVSGWTFNDAKDQVVGGSTANNPVSVHVADLPLNGTLFDNGVALTAPGDVPWSDLTAGLTFRPDQDWNGLTSFGFTVTDDGGATSALATANISVTAVNDAPVNTVPLPVSVAEDALTPIAGIQISDVDADPNAVQVTLSVSNGTLQVNGAVAPALQIANNGTGSVVLTGTLAEVNATLGAVAGLQYQSILNYNGPDTLTVSTSDLGATGSGGTLMDIDPVAITVTPVADAPVNAITPVNVPANASPTIPLIASTSPDVIPGIQVHDGDLNDTLFVDIQAGTGVTGLSWGNGTTLAPQYVFAGTEGYLNSLFANLNGLKAHVAAGFSGPATVLITTTDLSGLSDTDTLTITFDGPTSAAPQITTGQVAYTVYEDHVGPVSLGSCVSVTDPNSDPLTVHLTVSAGWSGLNATPFGLASVTPVGGGTVLDISGSMSDVQATLLTLQGTLITDFNGTATFNVTVTDNINPIVTAPPVDVPVIAVNDAPVNTVPVSVAVDEDVLTPISGISISDVDAGTSPVQVTLSVTNGTLHVNGAVAPGLLVANNGTNSVVLNGTLAEINATLLNATGLQYQSALDYNGPDTLTVVSDDLGASGTPGPLTTDTDPVAITVNAVNDAPVNTVPVSALANTNVLSPITGISIADVDADPSAVQVTLSVTNGTLQVSDAVGGGLGAAGISGNNSASVVLTGTLAEINATLANATGLQYLSGLDYVGADTLTVSTSDQGATGSGGIQTDSDPVAITVSAGAVNDPPVITLSNIVQQTDANGAVIFNLANGNLISVGDPDAGTGLLQVTLTATNGTLTLNGTANLDFNSPGGVGDGTADATMTFTGTLTDINAALDGMTFNGNAGYVGLAEVTVTVNDQGNTGSGGAQSSAPGVVNISVEPYDVWFQGFGPDAGWDVFNYSNGDTIHTHTYVVGWRHIASTGAWEFYNTVAWVGTDALGNAPYADGNGPYATWFLDTVPGGVYNGYEVFIGDGVTQISLDHTAPGATMWQQTVAGAWSYFDGSAWNPTAGFNVEPMNVWFHGYGPDAGWDVFNYSNGDTIHTHTYVVGWRHIASTGSWEYYNGTAWVPTTGLGVVV